MEQSIFMELKKIDHLIARNAAKTAKSFPNMNLTEGHANVLLYLMKASEEGVMQSEIEQAFTIRKSTASRILKLMERNGYIERHGVDYDARKKRIVLTKKAKQFGEEMRAEGKRMELKMRENISEEELDIFFQVLHKISSNIME